MNIKSTTARSYAPRFDRRSYDLQAILLACTISLLLVSLVPGMRLFGYSPPGLIQSTIATPQSGMEHIAITDLDIQAGTMPGAQGAACEPWEIIPGTGVITASQNLLLDVSAVSPNDVWAVGVYNISTYSERLIEHWDGYQWSIVDAPFGNIIPFAVEARAADDVWVVGGTAILHWDGKAWTTTPNPGEIYLNDVAAVTADDVWAVGSSYLHTAGPNITLHWDGTTWSTVPSPSPGSTFNDLTGVVAIASDDVWAVGVQDGRTLTMHWNGNAWIIVPSPNVGTGQNQIEDVSAIGTGDVWAVGGYWDPVRIEHRALSLHWDGTEWTQLPVPNPTGDYRSDYGLKGVASLTPTDVWAVGGYIYEDNRALLEHWDGVEWRVVAGDRSTGNYLRAVSADDEGNVWTVGSTTVVDPMFMHYAGGITFSDVYISDYFHAAVNHLYCNGAISGYNDGTFRPASSATRGQLLKIMVLAEGWPIYTPATPTFTDVSAGHPFYGYIETAFQRGIVSGYDDGTFRPGNDVTRGQVSKIVVGAEGWPIDTSGGPHFSDVSEGSTFYEYIETAYNHQIVSGYSDGTYRPGNEATRGQLSKIVHMAITQP